MTVEMEQLLTTFTALYIYYIYIMQLDTYILFGSKA